MIPAFTVSELTAAFQIGFLVSLPFKLLLFLLPDGWAKLIHGLVLTYA